MEVGGVYKTTVFILGIKKKFQWGKSPRIFTNRTVFFDDFPYQHDKEYSSVG